MPNMAGARINDEYGMLRCVTSETTTAGLCEVIEARAEEMALRDLCVMVNSVPRVATYVPGTQDHRADPEPLAIAS